MLGVMLYLSWGYAASAQLFDAQVPRDVPAAICRRIEIGQSLYALGALMCIINTYWSIGFIVLVQLNFVFALRFWRRSFGEPGDSTS